MENLKVIKVDSDEIEFEGGVKLYSYHWGDCCEEHYLDLTNLTLDDFDGLEFNLIGDDFFERIKDYGIALKPINGHPVRIPGYSSNNGYYSSNLELVLKGHDFERRYDIEECQDWYQSQ
jgi:hypothetical protein